MIAAARWWMAAITLQAEEQAREVWRWLRPLGGAGLILLGVVDSSAIPTPGSMDAVTILLTAGEPDWWWYYALMAVIGSVLGAYISYRLGRKAGKEGLEKRFPREKLERVFQKFEKHTFLAVFVPAMLPPPVPVGVFLMAAGALRSPLKTFMVAITLAKMIRYSLVAYLGAVFGQQITGWLGQYWTPILIGVLVLILAGAIFGLWAYLRHRRENQS